MFNGRNGGCYMGKRITLILIIIALAGGILTFYQYKVHEKIIADSVTESAQVLSVSQADCYTIGDTMYVHGDWGYGNELRLSDSGVVTDSPMCGIRLRDHNNVKKIIFGKFARIPEWESDDCEDTDYSLPLYSLSLKERYPGLESVVIEKGNPYLKYDSKAQILNWVDARNAKAPYFQ